RRPPLRLLLVVRLVPDLRVEPALDAGWTERRPQHVVLVEIHVTRAEAGVDRRGLLRLRVVHLELPAAGRERKGLARRMIRASLAPRQRRVLPDARRRPDPALAVHREAMRAGLAVPDRLLA